MRRPQLVFRRQEHRTKQSLQPARRALQTILPFGHQDRAGVFETRVETFVEAWSGSGAGTGAETGAEAGVETCAQRAGHESRRLFFVCELSFVRMSRRRREQGTSEQTVFGAKGGPREGHGVEMQ